MFKLDFTIFQKYYKFRFLYCILAEESRNYFFSKKISGISQKYRGNGLLTIQYKDRFIFKLKNSVLSRLQGKYI
ncbi:hypothetical protein LRU_01105 [Ligilactobacillus ruminis SPM0211]|uniref:Uncharacterized protein n=1 Tax=Ligilactobacillus ruminis SPM0211 TaxID=1040964 RepID=F7R0L5_9LACO|nr:hypothetical protein LRU_01105 [Ligilactobacillus ruminis SPM0211]